MANDTTHRPSTNVAFVVIPRFNMMTLTGLIEPMRIANYISPTALYNWRFHAVTETEISASNGMTLSCTRLPERFNRDDIVFILGSWGCERSVSPDLIAWTRRQARLGIRIGAVELGSYVLARGGLLDGKPATTHWSCLAGMGEQFPDIALTEQLFTSDRKIMTCAGGTAGIDLMLSLIADQHDEKLAYEVSEQMLHTPVRKPDAPQRRMLGPELEILSADVRAAIKLIETHVSDPLPVPEIAARVGLSQRQLERQFKRAVGCTIVQFGSLLRLQHARVLLVSTSLGIREIAIASGFNSMAHFAHAFGKCFGKRPSQYRQAWPDQDDAPSWPGTLYAVIDKRRHEAAQQNPL